MNELNRLMRYIEANPNIQYSSGIDEDKIQQMLDHENLQAYEKPDILSKYQQTIIAIEHFEFDNHSNNRNGSKYKTQMNKIKKDFRNKVSEEISTKNPTLSHDQIANNNPCQHYYDNFKNVLLAHIEKIPQYLSHIKEDGHTEDVEVWFFAEDASPFGNVYEKNGSLHSLLPLSPDTITFLEQHKEVAGLILGMHWENKCCLYIAPNNSDSLEELRKKHASIDKSKIISFNSTQVFSFAAQIPSQEQ